MSKHDQPCGFNATFATPEDKAEFVRLVKLCAGVDLDWFHDGGTHEPIIKWARRRAFTLRQSVRARVKGIYEGITYKRAELV